MSASSTASLSKTFTYYDTGTPKIATDVNGAQATYVYGTGSCGNSFPTTINEPLSLSRSIVWNCTGGAATQVTDENNKIVTSSYTDPYFWRPASITDQLQNSTTFSYFPTSMSSSLVFNNNTSIAETGIGLDGLGRPIVTNHEKAPGVSTWDTYPQSYDSSGRLSQIYMPCETTGAWTCLTSYTSVTYDALNRPLATIDGGTGTLTRTYSQNDVLVTLGPAPLSGGEHVKSRQHEYDGLGRLTSVCEILASAGNPCGQSSSASGYKTTYTYSVPASYTSQLVVTQGSQTRTYVRDGLGRLVSEKNPESGTTTYVYDADPTICGTTFKGDLIRKGDANGNNICYFYDSPHRLTDVGTLNNGNWVVGSCKRFRYDNVGNAFFTPSGYQGSNLLGRLVEAETDSCPTYPPTAPITNEVFSYDARGQMTDMWELTPNSGGYYHTTAGYAANGAVTSLVLPAAAGNWTYTLDGEGRPFSATNGTTVNVASVTYNAASQPLVISYSALGKDNDTYTYYDTTGRMQTYAFTIGSTPKTITGTYGWNQNGTLQNLAITDPFYAVDQQTCNYLYDDLARLSSVDCGATFWQQNFTYDAYGNITKAVPTNGTGITWNPGYNPANNQYASGSGATYDNDGNLKYDTFNHYTSDAYGQMATINNNAITYDALGREVEKSNPTREILYSPVGKVAIMNGATTVSASFVPMPGGSSVNQTSGSTLIRHLNLQGTASVLSTLGNRSINIDKAFAPFGEVYNVGLAGGGETDFAGLSQDTLAGVNDSATRKQYPNQGRWLSPDPAGLSAVDPSNPQTWNRYAYVENQPCTSIDPLGLSDCNFNIAVNSSNPNLLTPQEATNAWDELNRILDLADVGATLANTSNADFTINLKNNPTGWQEPFGQPWAVLGKNDAWFGAPNNSATVWANSTEMAAAGMDMGIALGRVMTHEFGHWALQIVENRLAPGPLEVNIMKEGWEPILMTGLATLSRGQRTVLHAKCQKLHGGGGGGGGGNAGGGGDTFTFPPVMFMYGGEGGYGEWVLWPGMTVVIVRPK
jgi:RHS repeat-associated protein